MGVKTRIFMMLKHLNEKKMAAPDIEVGNVENWQIEMGAWPSPPRPCRHFGKGEKEERIAPITMSRFITFVKEEETSNTSLRRRGLFGELKS
ncbi:hypothetical protein CHS0354_009200 [Potamilus streckersoni]|uniref:Uncharacterized protein n=1 Tax=Potamilus streckersoni TaxID=2493646 RepID=A0AAE0SZ72_9BIVA|nr:hypothetical protein CHS0354_009200 [Potamilus streckersoni]